MTLFEIISIATSLILSFSLARTLTNLAPIFATEVTRALFDLRG